MLDVSLRAYVLHVYITEGDPPFGPLCFELCAMCVASGLVSVYRWQSSGKVAVTCHVCEWSFETVEETDEYGCCRARVVHDSDDCIHTAHHDPSTVKHRTESTQEREQRVSN